MTESQRVGSVKRTVTFKRKGSAMRAVNCRKLFGDRMQLGPEEQ